MPPADPERLAEAIIKLAQSRELRARMGNAGRERISKRFSLDAMTSQILATYAAVAPQANR